MELTAWSLGKTDVYQQIIKILDLWGGSIHVLVIKLASTAASLHHDHLFFECLFFYYDIGTGFVDGLYLTQR